MKDCNTPKVIEIACPDAPTLFHKVLIPAEMGDETTNPPKNGAYRNALVVYEATGSAFMYSSDGIYTFLAERGPEGPAGPEGPEGPEGPAGKDGKDGKDGVDGKDGKDGEDGADGFSPIATVTQTSTGATISITDAQGTTTATITDGEQGEQGPPGQDGADGFSPVATVTQTASGATISITDKDGTTTANVTNGTDGADGAPGADGADGFSPIATVTQTATGATISITDAQGTTTATVNNGQDAPVYTAGTNVQINNGVISATDTTYSDFTGTDGQTAGTAGLVPAPATTDAGEYLKADGTWDTPPGVTYTAGANIQINGTTISATDTTYSDFGGATSSVAGSAGLVPAPTTSDPDKYLKGDGTWAEPAAKLVEMSYGESNAWAKFIAAYNAGSIVYCRASSNANPGSGSQTRKAFMAYVNNATTPTSVEFQYVRSVSSKTSSQPVDQVYVYTLTNANGGTWSVANRDMGPKLAAGTNTSVSYGSGTYTVSATDTTYSAFTGTDGQTAGTAGLVPAPATTDADKFLKSDGTWATAGGGGGAVTYYIADGDPNYPQTLSSGFIYEDAARTTRAEADDIYADIQSGKIVYLEYRTGPATDRRETLFTINSMTRRDAQGIVDRYDYFGTITSYMDGSNTTQPATFGFLVQGTEPVTWQFVQQYIPTVNNGTLTIKQNGANVQTFTANSSTNKTANIDIHNGVMTADNLSPTADTTDAWGSLFGEEGVYWTFYSQAGRFANQPTTYGYLETVLHRTTDLSGWEVFQRWHHQANGYEYYRSGNAVGWYSNANAAGTFRYHVDNKFQRLTITKSSNLGSDTKFQARQDGSLITLYGAFYVSTSIAANAKLLTISNKTLLDTDGVTTGSDQYGVNAIAKTGTTFRLCARQNGSNIDILVDSNALGTGWFSLSGVITVSSWSLN